MSAASFLESRLKSCSWGTSNLDDEKLRSLGLSGYIYSKVTSKKFRKWAIDEASEKQIKKAIDLSVERAQPIKFTYPFGGYKLWRFLSSPEVDWAEFFAIAYYRDYLLPIAAVYGPGVNFCFSSDDIIIERMDNISSKETNDYFDSFSRLLSTFRQFFPDNLKMEIKRVADLYENREEFERDLKVNIGEQLDSWGDMDPKRKERMIRTSALNINFNGVSNWSSFTEEERLEKMRMGVVLHDAYGKVPRRVAFVRGEDKVVVFTTVIPNAVAIGTTKNSITKFWTGRGFLERKENSFSERVVSFDQWNKVKALPHETESSDLIPLKNFSTVDVYPTPFDFTRGASSGG